jgi:hypothetical protein
MRILKALGITLSLLFGLSLVFLPIVKDHVSGEANAKTVVFPAPSPEQSTSPVNCAPRPQEVNYYLPYPGILPDHPLYWLKMVRDRIKLDLTKDSLDHYQLLLLYADKRIGAAQVLIEGNKVPLGVSTAVKAEKYIQRVLSEFENLKKAGKTTAMMEDQLVKATAKHQEVLQKLFDKAGAADQGQIRTILEDAQRSYQRALNLTGKKG